jgi:hypothetical protein
MSVGTGRQNIIILILETTFSFLGIQKWEPDINIGFSQALHLQCTRVSHWFGAIRKCSQTINCGIYIYIPFDLLLISWNSVYKVTTHALVKTETWNLGTWVNDHTDRQPQGHSLFSLESQLPFYLVFLFEIYPSTNFWFEYITTYQHLSATVIANKLKIFPCF